MLLLSAQTPETECLYNDHRTTFNNSKFKIQNSKLKTVGVGDLNPNSN
jgi:hypothetical protein